MDYFIYVVEGENVYFLDFRGRPCSELDLMGSKTAWKVFKEAIGRFPSTVHLSLWIDGQDLGYIPLDYSFGKSKKQPKTPH